MTNSVLTETAVIRLTRRWTCVLFDLDGTIMDSAPGITDRLAKTLVELGRPVPSEQELMRWVGPPILDSFRDFAGMDPEQAREALTVYRRFAQVDGPYDGSAVFPGVAGLIVRLHKAGIPIALATSKPESQAVMILDHFDLSQYFTVLCGASEDESRSAKSDIVAETLLRLQGEGVDLSQVVLVGDRSYDVAGATAHDIPTIMVEWGYGSPAEAEGTMAVVHSADQLGRLLLG
ncbi:HAD hydrolase-like protein [Homoserinimonas sp. OAct 916]|uniref:HAD hydrolase-like protein n=1 Tax=Homoserinimonas sp. OAct 916 TaxID=2211450 RepID=UPI000DBEA49B|nr:HAD hydrolase-like protein [Homoserinimonas sp. OAct 916]